jgi:adenosylcobinamide-phosphate synthase
MSMSAFETFAVVMFAALVFDVFVGDPRLHPVRLLGEIGYRFERTLRANIRNEYEAGGAVVIGLVALTGLVVWLLLLLSEALGLEVVVSFLLIWLGVAVGDMVTHSAGIYKALKAGDLADARSRVGMICGRDTSEMNEKELIKASVESVSESAVDGVIAPIFYAVLGGPVLMWVYKAINTCDSQFGYKNEKYLKFGWFAAKLDDIAGFIPARIAGLVVPIAAWAIGLDAKSSFRVFRRDRCKHPSPNAAHAEAAAAGALGLELGGVSYYGGVAFEKPLLGDPIAEPRPEHIILANSLLVWTAFIGAGALLLIRWLIA